MRSIEAAPSSVKSMTTSSSDRSQATPQGRCTRISPSAILDDRLQGKELEWARDHLLHCDACRERVEDFREMLLRVGKLPSIPIATPTIEQAYAAVVPEAMRDASAVRTYSQPRPPIETEVAGTTMIELPSQPSYAVADVAEVLDPLSDLEREIFRDTPWEDRPQTLPPLHPPGIGHEEADLPFAHEETVEAPAPTNEPIPAAPPVPELLTGSLKPVAIDSHRFDPPALDPPPTEPWFAEPQAEPPDQVAEEPLQTPPPRTDNVMRIAVGLGAAACVLLAAVLYEGGGLFSSPSRKTAATATPRPSVSASLRPSSSATPSTLPSTSAPAVIAQVGDGATGESVLRIRPGSALPTFTRLVFDLSGSGLPAMVVSKPDDLHVLVTFRNTKGANVPVNGIHSIQVAGVEPAVQDGADLTFTIDLNRPVRPVVFTMAPSGGHPYRLVLDLYSS